jgi:hypothetical protein
MSRAEYDVAEPHEPDVADDPPDGPVCPHCGGGPPVDVPALGLTCKSCARVLVVRRPT